MEALIEEIMPRFMVLDTLTALIKASKGRNSYVFRSHYAEVERVRKLAEHEMLLHLPARAWRKG